MSRTVVGLFNDADDARNAVEELAERGFDRSQVDCSLSTKNATMSSDSDRHDDDHDDNAITRFFKSLFGDDDDEATKYSNASRNRSVVTVHVQSEDEAEKAAEILDDLGAVDVDENDSNDRDRSNFSSGSRDSDMDDRNEQRIDVVEENLEVGKREVETGGVSIRSRIVERPVEEQIRLKNERVWVDRQQVDRPLDADADNFQERNIELTERSEIPVVNKEARVVEEIRVGKETEHTSETIHDSVRKTEVDIDKKDSDSNPDRRRERDL